VDLTEVQLSSEQSTKPGDHWKINCLTEQDDEHYHNDHRAIEWVIQGCESGKDRRPFEIGWARSVRDACLSAGVAYYLKQVPLELVNDPGIRSEASKLSRGVLHEPWLDGKKHLSLPWEDR
jgi:hypothetical protein